MEFSAKRSDLLKELDLAQGVVEKKATIPILSNLLLESSDEGLRLSATDLELGIRSGCAAKVKKSGTGTLPARRLVEIVRSLPDAEIRFKMLENQWVHVTCERSSFKLAGMAKDNFPALPAVPKALATLPAGILRRLIERTAFAIANEESRYTLNGSLLMLKPESALMVATDGHRLALIERRTQIAGLTSELRLLIPKKALGELQKLLAEGEADEPVELSKDENHLFFSLGGRTLIARLLTGQFPNYEAVLPRENKQVAQLDRERLASAVRRVAILADERSHAIRVRLAKDQLEIFSSSGEYGEAHETLDADYAGEPIEIGFNYQYLLDFLGVADGEAKILFELKDEQSAGQFRLAEEEEYRYRYVVMPMRI